MSAHQCVSAAGETRDFPTYAAAYDFVMKEGDKSKLWSLAPVRSFLSLAIERATVADAVYQSALDGAGLDRWSPSRPLPDVVKVALAAKVHADRTVSAAFAISRGEAIDVAAILTRDDDFAVNALVISGASFNNIEILNALAGFDLTKHEWSTAFGGQMAYGQGVIQDAIWSRVRAVRHAAEASRAILA